MKAIGVVVAVALTLPWIPRVEADVIRMKHGGKFEGTIVSENEHEVVVEIHGFGRETIQKADIESIEVVREVEPVQAVPQEAPMTTVQSWPMVSPARPLSPSPKQPLAPSTREQSVGGGAGSERRYEVRLKDGTVFEGQAAGEGPDGTLLFNVSGRGQVRIRRDEIQAIDWPADIRAQREEKIRAILSPEEQAALKQATEQSRDDPFAGVGWMLGEGAPIAEKLTRNDLKATEATYGQDAVESARMAEVLGWQLAAQEKFDEAESTLRRALAIYHGTLGPNSTEASRVTQMLDGIQQLRRKGHRIQQAPQHFRQQPSVTTPKSRWQPTPPRIHRRTRPGEE